MICPVCRVPNAEQFIEIDGHQYFRCIECRARFLDKKHFPNAVEEREQYELHENRIDDPCYRAYLDRLADPLKLKLRPNSQGLDYGCGPGPALAAMMREAQHDVTVYDPFFAPNAAALRRQYDFVTCTEVVEHFHTPAKEFERLDDLLRPNAWLAIMTCFQTDDAKFRNWHYRKDPTHVVFYRRETFEWLAAKRSWTIEIPRKDIVLLRKPAS